MPTRVTRGGVGLSRLEQIAFPASYRPDDVMIGPLSSQASGEEGVVTNAWVSATYPAANRAIGYMFCLGESYLVRKVWWANGTTATTNNADVGVYDEAGTTLLVSAGSTLIATANVLQEKDVTDTLLVPGRYWCVYNQNGTTATPIMNPSVLPSFRAAGWAQFAGAVPLGATFTPAALAAANVPYFGIASRTQVA